MSTDQILTRTHPFVNAKWINDYLSFNPTTDSTFCEFEKGKQLFNLVGDYIVDHIDQSYKFTPKKNVSKATQILENLARIAKQHKDLKNLDDDEKKQQQIADQEKKLQEKAKQSNKVTTSLGLGLHEFQWKDHKIYALHQTIGNPVSTYYGAPQFFQSLVLFIGGRGNLKILQNFCNYIVEQSETKKDSLFFPIYQFNMQQKYWRQSGKKIARDPDTIILPSKTWKKLIDDFERFCDEKSIKWYFEHGIPYKRSYLFYGVPGSGKSSLIQALAAKYDRNLCFLQPSHPMMTDETFKTCIQSAPGNSLIILEDIDALFGKDRSKKHKDCPLTFSGLLNGLDGVGNPDGQIFIMTTNFVDALDNALIRSGRVDLHIEFPLATDEQLEKMFLLFYKNGHDLSQEFVKQIRDNFKEGISMAAVQQHFIQNMLAQPKIVIENVKQLGDRLDVVVQFDQQQTEEEKKEEKKEEDKDTKNDKKKDKKKINQDKKENIEDIEDIENGKIVNEKTQEWKNLVQQFSEKKYEEFNKMATQKIQQIEQYYKDELAKKEEEINKLKTKLNDKDKSKNKNKNKDEEVDID